MLKVHTRKLDNVAIVCLRGRIVNGETAALREAVAGQSHVKMVILDLARVTTIDASGLGLMLQLRKQTEARGIGFKLMNVSQFVRQVSKLRGWTRYSKWSRGPSPCPRSRARIARELTGRRVHNFRGKLAADNADCKEGVARLLLFFSKSSPKS